MSNFEDQLSAAEARVVAASPGLLSHIIVLLSAAAFSFALKLALQLHLDMARPYGTAVAAGTFIVLAALHMRFHPRAPRIAPAHRSHTPRRERPERVVAQPAADRAEPALPAAPPPPPVVSAPVAPAAPLNPAGLDLGHPVDSGVQPQTDDGFEHLQNLVAELARMTPGPKAATPDPDAVQGATAVAWAEYAAARQAQATLNAQASALEEAARVMAAHEMAPPPPPARAPDPAPAAAQSLSARSNFNAPVDLFEPAPLSGFAADLADALDAERLTIYLEPIQQIEFERPRHYEVSVRFKDAGGAELPHEAVLAAARDSGLLPRVDAALLPRAARIAQHFQLRGRDTEILTRVHGVSLPEQEFRAEIAAATIAADGAALVLSFAQDDVRGFGPIHWEILSTIADMGLRFAIEAVTDLDMDIEALRQRGFNFVKLDADVLLKGLPSSGGLIPAADVCRHFASAGIGLIVSHIDDEQMLARILGFGVLLGQGALFGTRRAVRADLLAKPSAAA